MTHSDAGHYAGKHPAGTVAKPEAIRMIRDAATDGTITCAAAHAIAASLGSTPAQVGTAIDLCEVRLIRCQLGLFGHEPESSVIKPADRVSEALGRALQEAAPGDRIACAALWSIAAGQGITRMDAAAACERLGIKIRPCQLGAF